jgi:hypothetical protein
MMKVYAALKDDVGEGHVWLEWPGFPARCVVRITNGQKGPRVYCEALQFEKNFLAEYNQPPRFRIDTPASSIVMSYWYRARLGGLETQQEYPLDVKKTIPIWGSLRACMQHPEVVVRVAAWLGLLSVALGLLGVILAVCGWGATRGPTTR